MTDTMFLSTGYMDTALDPEGLAAVIDRAKKALADVDFDTMVGTGFSGGVVIPALAMAMGKSFVLVRKEEDTSHHGPGRLLGHLGRRWIFVDDFISTGKTRQRVLDKVAEAAHIPIPWEWDPVLLSYKTPPPFETTYVGDYTYVNFDKPGWTPAEENS